MQEANKTKLIKIIYVKLTHAVLINAYCKIYQILLLVSS